METRTLNTLMAREPNLWTCAGLAPGCSLGESIPDWSEAPIGLPVLLEGKNLPSVGGRVDSKMEDGSAIWIRDEYWSRRLVHRSEGYTLRVVIRWQSLSGRQTP